MKSADIAKILEHLQPTMDAIEDPAFKHLVSVLLNLIEGLVSENTILRQEIQALKDEINRLKGEQGKPDIKANTKKDGNISSEQERRQAETLEEDIQNREGFKLDKSSIEKLKEDRIPVEILRKLESLNDKKYSRKEEFMQAVEAEIGKEGVQQYGSLLAKHARYKKRTRKPKLSEIAIDREEICPMDKEQLPDDAVFKGYEKKVVQDLLIKTDNVLFKREVYHSPNLSKTYIGAVPQGYDGEFGPHINAQIVSLKYVNNMSIPKIQEFLTTMGIVISGCYISNRLSQPKHMDVFHREKSQMYQASLETSSYQQIDDTGSRVDGQNHYTHVICNPLCSVFFTTKRKDRLTILDILRNFGSRSFVFNEETFALLEKLKIPRKLLVLLHDIERDRVLSEQEMTVLLHTLFPDPDTGTLHRTRILEASAIACYHQETGIPVVTLMLGDDAPQFKLITDEFALCWVHDGRHYTRLRPLVPHHQKQLDAFRQRYWEYYRELFTYKSHPCAERAELLSAEFDSLFSTKTGYDDLDERIAKSKAKKQELLVVLTHPEIPLHNNRSENGVRVQKRREDVSLQTKSCEGTKSKDSMMSIVETCKKLGVNAYHFIYDRVSQKFQMPSLAELIRTRAASQPPPYNSS